MTFGSRAPSVTSFEVNSNLHPQAWNFIREMEGQPDKSQAVNIEASEDDPHDPNAFFTIRREPLHRKGFQPPMNPASDNNRPYFQNPKTISIHRQFRNK